MFKYKIIIFLLSFFIFNSCSKNEKKASTWDFYKNPPKIVFAVEGETDQYWYGFNEKIIDSLDHLCYFSFAIVPFEPIIVIDTSDFQFSPILLVDSLLKNNIYPEYDGLQLLANINDTIPTTNFGYKMNSKFPLFIINQTNRIKHIGELFIFQEAYHKESNLWAPISFSCFKMCGTKVYVNELNPDHCLIVEVPRFIGNYKTKIRVKLKSGNCIYTSNEFTGYINESQFFLKKYELNGIKKRYQRGLFDFLELQPNYSSN